MNTTFGIIDIGSNTIRLNIYKIDNRDFRVIMSEKSAAGLVSYIQDGALSEEGIFKLESVLHEFKEILEVLHVKDYAVFATASLRNISNSAQVLEAIHERCGIPIDLLSGSQEGCMSFSGALHGLAHEEGMYIDTGGGSTEVVLYAGGDISFAASMPIGSLNLFNKYVGEIVPTKNEAEKIQKRVEKEMKAIAPDGQIFQVKNLAVTGGSMRAVREVLVSLKWIKSSDFEIEPSMLKKLVKYLLEDASRTIRLFLKVKPDRIHTLFTGLLIVDAIARLTGCKTVQVSVNGVREGYLVEKVINTQDA
ncbi:MAG: hypothetical protein HUJ54_01985 [Erysipelotrichaceae bacterium]|nr:hypothetical protein [Erysipelotrichaceae bacterium]